MPPCSSLTTLALRYGMRAVGMDYDRALFGIKLSDCRSLARCLEFCETLVVLDLRGALLDDDKLRMLASGLINNVSVVHLNLSANRIADRGVRALAKLLNPNSIIQVVNLADNQVPATQNSASLLHGNRPKALHWLPYAVAAVSDRCMLCCIKLVPVGLHPYLSSIQMAPL